MLIIEHYSDARKDAFKSLNIAWLEKYFTVEPVDDALLSDPRGAIINKGGEIFFAVMDGAVVGTCALLFVDETTRELGKMAVTETMQGGGIGKKLLDYCIDHCRRKNIHRIVLYSNTLLGPAIHLYRKYGFAEVPLEPGPYKRSNIKMEKHL